jgi:LPXTG-motif cell wall-anchored protein
MRCQICEEETLKPHENALDCIQAYQVRLRSADCSPPPLSIMDAIREWRDPAEAWKGEEDLSPMMGTILNAAVTALGLGLGMSLAGLMSPKKKKKKS